VFTLTLALLGALLLGASWEGTIKARPALAACAFFQLGRVRAVAWAYRPGRLYVRLGVRCGS